MSAQVETFNDNEKHILKNHFSNSDKNVFVITTPSQTDRGALMSRYSRTDKSMRRIFLDEFASNPDRGEEFYNKVLLEYGDDSVAELGQAQVAIEGISQVAVKKVEDRRIGFSFLEKSSRYVLFDTKVGGRYPYLLESTIMNTGLADAYTQFCDLAFDTYAKMKEPMSKFLREKIPITHESLVFSDSERKSDVNFSDLTNEDDRKKAQSVYDRSIKPLMLDTIRGVLPASALTNVGITGEGRGFEYLLSIMYSSNLAEMKSLGKEMHQELDKNMKSFVSRADDNYGKRMQSYLRNLEEGAEIRRLIGARTDGYKPRKNFPTVQLLDYDGNNKAERKVIEAIFFEKAAVPYQEVRKIVKKMGPEERAEVIREYTSGRENRRQRPGRAYEMVDYTFGLLTNFGIFRDLHRHRILTMERQRLTTKHGYEMPEDIESAGFKKDFEDVMYKSNEVFGKISANLPEEAQYVVTFAHKYPYMIKLNARELAHLTEIRTISGGHPDYRKVAQGMHTQVSKVHPNIASGIKFVDYNDYLLGRYKSEKRTAEKLSKMEGS